MEFVFVDYPTSRRVNMDGQMFGRTRKTLACPAGHHTFDMHLPVNYSPASQDVNVTGTTPTQPLHILFVPLSAAVRAVTAEGAKKKTAKKKKKEKSMGRRSRRGRMASHR